MADTETRIYESCVYCEAAITKSPVDGAWEDSSGACGCGIGEHEPYVEGSFTAKIMDDLRTTRREG